VSQKNIPDCIDCNLNKDYYQICFSLLLMPVPQCILFEVALMAFECARGQDLVEIARSWLFQLCYDTSLHLCSPALTAICRPR